MSIYAKKQDLEAHKRKVGALDQRFMKRAEDLLFGELAAGPGHPPGRRCRAISPGGWRGRPPPAERNIHSAPGRFGGRGRCFSLRARMWAGGRCSPKFRRGPPPPPYRRPGTWPGPPATPCRPHAHAPAPAGGAPAAAPSVGRRPMGASGVMTGAAGHDVSHRHLVGLVSAATHRVTMSRSVTMPGRAPSAARPEARPAGGGSAAAPPARRSPPA